MSNRRRAGLSSAGLALAIALAMSQSAPSTAFQTQRRLDVIEWPNREFRTIQSAIDALPDGGTLRFAAGVVTTEPLVVRGKRIVIEGAGAGCDEQRQSAKPKQTVSTHLVGPRPETVAEFGSVRGLINYEDAGPGTIVGGGTIRNLRLSGSDAGIRGAADADAVAGGGVAVEDVCITDTGRGVAWAVGSTLSMKNVLIQGVLWNGVSISPSHALATASFIFFDGVTVINAANACVFYKDVQAVVTNGLFNLCGSSGTIVALNSNLFISDTNIIGSRGPGIAMSGGSAFIQETFINEATGFGLLLHNVVHGDIEDVRVKDTKAFTTGPQAGLYGDGVTVVGGTANGMVWVTDSFIENGVHSGIANYGGFVTVGDSKIQCTLFHLEGEVLGTTNFSYTDLGGMKCGCPTATGTCEAVTGSGLQPPPPITQIQ